MEPAREHLRHNRRVLLEHEDAIRTIASELERCEGSPGRASLWLEEFHRGLGSNSVSSE
jgi:hypothetical protein